MRVSTAAHKIYIQMLFGTQRRHIFSILVNNYHIQITLDTLHATILSRYLFYTQARQLL